MCLVFVANAGFENLTCYCPKKARTQRTKIKPLSDGLICHAV